MNVDEAVKAGIFGFWSSAEHWLTNADRALSAFGFLLLVGSGAALFVMLGYGFLYAVTGRERFEIERPVVTLRAQQVAVVLFVLADLVAGIATVQLYRYSPDSDMAQAWKRKQVAPLLAALPEQRMALVKAEPQAQPGGSGFRPFYPEEGVQETVSPMQLVYKDGHGEEQSLLIWAVVKVDQPSGTASFMTYKQLEWDLGHGVDRGIYNPIVHVPKP